MSLVSPENKIDLLGLIDNIIKNDEKVWFWVADQLGKGEFNGIENGCRTKLCFRFLPT